MEPSRRLSIRCNLRLTPETLALLEEAVAPYGELLYAAGNAVSVLGASSESLEGATVAFGQPDPAAMLASSTLRWVHISSAGITRYDAPEYRAALKERGIMLTNSSSVYDTPCAEHLLAFLLAAGRNLPAALASRCDHRSPEWQALRESCVPLREQKVLILGYGAIAERFVEMLAPLGMQVTGYRRSPRGDEAIPMVAASDLPAALGAADHLVNILPDSAETVHFFGKERFAQAKPGAIFYNVGRGTTVDQAALVEALESGHLSAAWLDVTDPEPLADHHPLRGIERCYITPHVAGGHTGERETLVRHFLGNFERFLRSEPLQDRVV